MTNTTKTSKGKGVKLELLESWSIFCLEDASRPRMIHEINYTISEVMALSPNVSAVVHPDLLVAKNYDPYPGVLDEAPWCLLGWLVLLGRRWNRAEELGNQPPLQLKNHESPSIEEASMWPDNKKHIWWRCATWWSLVLVDRFWPQTPASEVANSTMSNETYSPPCARALRGGGGSGQMPLQPDTSRRGCMKHPAGLKDFGASSRPTPWTGGLC